MQEYGIEELGLSRMIRLSYDLLQLQSFFTVGEDEVRAWTVDRGATAVEAAGAIHTDLQHGFVRAEVVAYDDLMALGGMNEAKTKGKLQARRQGVSRQGRGYRARALQLVTSGRAAAACRSESTGRATWQHSANARDCIVLCCIALALILACGVALSAAQSAAGL